MTITSITKNIAEQINSGTLFKLHEFIEKGNCNDIMLFSHYNFFYTYPEFGKKWKNEQSCNFHRVDIKCNHCEQRPERNKIGVGNIYLLHNGVSDAEILIIEKNKSCSYIKNTPRLSQMVCLCSKHVASYFHFNQNKKTECKQLKLF